MSKDELDELESRLIAVLGKLHAAQDAGKPVDIGVVKAFEEQLWLLQYHIPQRKGVQNDSRTV